ncbi:MAG: tRNA 4-thiouridine(8) synthase ThiI [Tenericutes bacterium]|nr:tRNA 4-thiouridine(8) synthase ThiI [Mycoplasmatota bacterium]
MYGYVMVRYGDLSLKGRNKNIFKNTLNNQLRFKLSELDVKIEFQHDLIYIELGNTLAEEVIKVLETIAGFSSYSKVVKTVYDFDKISENALAIIKQETKERVTTFKIETKRADKSVPLTSLEITQQLSKKILSQVNNLLVDVHHPEMTLYIEVRKDATYLYVNRIPAIGGFPVSMGGKAMVLLSGGIDSPVSAFLAMKKGLEVECIHFESTPLTSIESAQKVIDLTEKLAKFAPRYKIKLHMVPFRNLHEQLMLHVNETYTITVMRRMMYRIATELAIKNNCLAIVSGDSIGQVASQTLESMNVIQVVTNHLIIRPLATYDKMEIVKIAEKIDTLAISIKPFSDCCTVYVPKNPIIKPKIAFAEKNEAQFDYLAFIEEAVANTKTVIIDANSHLDILSKGLVVSECI